jgi:FlaA1/EpsC-like NDP-sugar epimerase
MLARVTVLTLGYTAIITLSLFLAYELRFDFRMPTSEIDRLGRVFWWLIPLKIVLLLLFRQFEGLLSYFSVPDLRRILYANAVASAILVFVWFYTHGAYAPPRGVILADFILSVTGISSLRLLFRLVRENYLSEGLAPHRAIRRVGIIGAGDAGATLARELATKRGLGLRPVVFFDDDPGKWRSRVHDIPVVGSPEQLLNQKRNLELDLAIIAMPSASAKRIGEVVRILQQTRLSFQTVPAISQLATGRVKVSQLRPVQIEDLLGREPVELALQHIRQILQDKVVMVTGAGGSIGAELCRQVASFNPNRLLLVDQSEVQMFAIEQELLEAGYGGLIVPLVADVLDAPRMRSIFGRFQPKALFHAAAHKHVPMMESQPSEAIKNNVLGTVGLGELALEFGVERFVLISTDKAINPTNVMGATKRLAEKLIMALHAQNHGATRFMAVRFGNVLGSSGSVVPLFQKQIAAGGPVKVTHADVTRYFMTIPEAVGLVLQSAAQGEGGEIFVLDMGKPVKIVDLARQMIELSGLRPDEDIEIEFVGLRPGEKLFEELSYHSENHAPTNHPKIMRFLSQPESIERMRAVLGEVTRDMYTVERNQLKMRLKQAVPEYQPYLV